MLEMLKLSSADRTASSAGSHNFTITQSDGSNLFTGKWRLVEALFPVSMYNITANNNEFLFTENVARTATIPPGFYDSETLATALIAAMNTISGGYNTFTFTINADTKILTITGTEVWRVTSANELSAVLGFPAAVSAVMQVSHAASYPVHFGKQLAFNIIIDEAAPAVVTTAGHTLTFTIPILANSQSVMFYAPPRAAQEITFRSCSSIHVRVVDEQNRPLDLQQADWYLLLGRW